MVATIKKTAHQKFTSDEDGQADRRGSSQLPQLDPDSDAYRTVTVTRARLSRRRGGCPAEFVAEQAQAVSAAQHAWIEARSRSDYAHFQPHLEKLINLKKRYIAFFPPAEHPYDILLDDFEPGVTTADVTALFATIRPRQVELIRAIAERPQVDDSFLRVPYPEARDVGVRRRRDLRVRIRLDPRTPGQVGTSRSPPGIGPDDVRITTRVVEREPFSLFFGTAHETGHALYEQGIDRAFSRTVLGAGASLGVHESQSRLWENLVGRSWPFWQHFFPKLQAAISVAARRRHARPVLPRHQQGRSAHSIRVESDEATYNLHIMLRVEMEIAMLTGDVARARSAGAVEHAHAGVPRRRAGQRRQGHPAGHPLVDRRDGLLRHVHAGQPDLRAALGGLRPRDTATATTRSARGDFSPLLAWLRTNVHQYGRKYQPQELVERVTGSRIDPEPYLRTSRAKYRGVYGLETGSQESGIRDSEMIF